MLLILLGGTFCSFVQPFADLLGSCWHPEIGQLTVSAFSGAGFRSGGIGYFTDFGALGALNYLL